MLRRIWCADFDLERNFSWELLWPIPSEPISFVVVEEDAEVDEDFWLLGGVSQNDGGNREVGRFPG